MGWTFDLECGKIHACTVINKLVKGIFNVFFNRLLVAIRRFNFPTYIDYFKIIISKRVTIATVCTWKRIHKRPKCMQGSTLINEVFIHIMLLVNN